MCPVDARSRSVTHGGDVRKGCVRCTYNGDVNSGPGSERRASLSGRACAGLALALSLIGLLVVPARAAAADTRTPPSQAETAVSVVAALTPPEAPRTVGRGTPFATTGLLQPAQPAGPATVTIHCYRSDGAGWVEEAACAATLSDAGALGSRFDAGVALPRAGVWRLRAEHQDADDSGSWSDWSRSIAVTPTPDQPIWDRDSSTSLPERMASRLNARQLIVVTGARPGVHRGLLRLYDYVGGDWVRRFAAPAAFGGNGLIDGLKRHSGTRTTPTGIWLMAQFAFGMHASAPKGCRLSWRRITPRSWWSSEHNGTYNTWVETSRRIDGEHLADYRVSYEYAVHTGYNALPNRRVYG